MKIIERLKNWSFKSKWIFLMKLNRRQMLISTALLTTSAVLGRTEKRAPYRYVLAKVKATKTALPEGKYIPFDWSFGEIVENTEGVGDFRLGMSDVGDGLPKSEIPNPKSNEGVHLSWNETNISKKSSVRLRITSATDVREVLVLEVKTAISGKKIADWNLQFAAMLQPFELEIPKEFIKIVEEEGITLTMLKGTKPFWFFSGSNTKSAPNAYLPHLLMYDSKSQKNEAWKDRILSNESLQTFGWQQGVVWDGMLEMSEKSPKAKAVLAQQLDLYFAKNSLVYCNLNNIKTVEKISTVESILPFAILAQTNPTHPLLKTAIEFCENHANTEGVIADGTGNNRMVKTEECYTVSYPLAVLAKMLNRPDLAVLAIKTLKSRILILEKGNSIYQRGTEQGDLFFENWGRGVAWYLLGIAKTLAHLPDSADKERIKESFQKSVAKVLDYQQVNGLWYNFFHQAETGYETSGTAGITAALSYALNKGLLSENVKTPILKGKNALLPYMTPDGFLAGTAQVNKGGDALQQNGFRVISPYTLGFLAYF